MVVTESYDTFRYYHFLMDVHPYTRLTLTYGLPSAHTFAVYLALSVLLLFDFGHKKSTSAEMLFYAV